MSEYVIIADSAMDLSKEQREEFKIEYPVLGGITYPDGTLKECDVDWEHISFEDFYRRLEKKQVFKTSFASPGVINEKFEQYLKQGKDILCVTLSGGMSGTYNTFLSVANELVEKYPDRKIKIVDSRKYSGGIGLICVLASNNRDKGMSIEENFNWLEEKKLYCHQIGILDDLFVLHRSGRISYMKAFMGTMVGVKPMADFANETGMPCVLGNARGYKKSYEVVGEFYKAFYDCNNEQYVVISHSIREKQALAMKDTILSINPNAKIIINKVGQSSGTNVGPGLAAVFFLGKEPISQNCEKERELFTKITLK